MRSQQRGISLISTLLVAVALIGAIILGMRAVPIYTEYFAVKKLITRLASSGEAQSPEAIRVAFNKTNYVEDIDSVTGQDLIISKRNGRFEISAKWERRMPLVANVSLLFEFEASSTGDAAAAL